MADSAPELRDTAYAEELARAIVDGARIERLFVKDEGQIEIRFSWWKDEKMAPVLSIYPSRICYSSCVRRSPKVFSGMTSSMASSAPLFGADTKSKNPKQV